VSRPREHPVLCSPDGTKKLGPGFVDEPSDNMVRSVPLLDLHQTIHGGDRLAVRAGREVAVPKRIPNRAALVRKLAHLDQ
jgi:hypothetical protein